MSTAGKVLSVLVTLMSMVMIVLVSMVTQLNRNGADAVAKLRTQLATVEKSVADASLQLRQLKDETYLEQVNMQSELTTLQVRQSDAEKQRAEVREILSRVQFKLAGVDSQIKSASQQAEIRGSELKDEEKAKADAIADVHRLSEENAALILELTSLRETFQKTLNENRARVTQMGGGEPIRSASRSY